MNQLFGLQHRTGSVPVCIDPTVAEAGVDDDGADLKAGRLQEHQAAVG